MTLFVRLKRLFCPRWNREADFATFLRARRGAGAELEFQVEEVINKFAGIRCSVCLFATIFGWLVIRWKVDSLYWVNVCVRANNL